MSLIPWKKKGKEQGGEIVRRDRFHDEIDRLFERFFNDPWGWPEGFGAMAQWQPSVDLTENAQEFVLHAEVPGVKAEDFNVSVSDNVLTLEGEKKEDRERTEGNLYHAERSYGKFVRRIPLPVAVDESRIAAEYRDGVLQVKLPKSQQATPKKIQVKS